MHFFKENGGRGKNHKFIKDLDGIYGIAEEWVMTVK